MLKPVSPKHSSGFKVGSHGEDYGSWMSNPVFYLFGGTDADCRLVLAALSFAVFHADGAGRSCSWRDPSPFWLAVLGWITWIRRQYAFGKGGMMERVHQTILSNLDYDGTGSACWRWAAVPAP